MIAPKQFYCDQATDGGGWVLVGRGREQWDFTHNGQRTEAAVASTPTGTSAFAPAALAADTIDGLLDGGRVDGLADGVRVRRASNSAGTAWQELRWKFSNRDRWSWAFGGQLPLSSMTISGTSYTSGANTRDFAPLGTGTTAKDIGRVITYQLQSHAYKAGFSYGQTITGANNSTSYLWQNASEGYAVPFAQVYVRPKITSVSYPAIPAGGTPASAVRPMLSDRAAAAPWGVTGLMPGGTWPETTEVHGLGTVGRTMFVGGRFEYVQKGAAATEKIRQPYLAAFNIDTGEWVRTFLPVLDGMVWDIQGMPDGKVVVAGDFTNVNGVPGTAGIAALDPTTGDVVPGFRANVEDRNTTTKPARVRALHLQGDWLYVGGTYTHIAGGVPMSAPTHLVKVARLRPSDGRPDAAWDPEFNGSVYDVHASPRGDRVYVVGIFSAVNGNTANQLAVLSTASGAPLVTGLQPWQPTNATRSAYQQTVIEVGDTVWQGGAEHNFQQYRRSDYALLKSHVTKRGGDFQTAFEIDGVVYGACHCNNYNYSDLKTWDGSAAPALGTYSNVNPIMYVGAWDSASGAYLPQFAPSLSARATTGPWDMARDANGCLWFGGDMTRGAGGWLGGFGKFCPRDTSVPSKPSGFTVTTGSSGNALGWTRSSDNSGSWALRYEVMRGDRVIATTATGATSYTDAGAKAGATYWVRAIDATGNRSASTSGVTAGAADTTAPSAPSGLTGAGVEGGFVDLRWTAATDNVGVAGYQVLRNGAVVASVTSTSHRDSGLAAGSTYRYAVRAFDAAGNVGPNSNEVSVTVPADSATTLVHSESWTGGDGSAWPSAWTSSSSSGAVQIAGNAGRLTWSDASGAYARSVLTKSGTSLADAEVLTSYRWSSNGAVSYFVVNLRGSGGWQNAWRPMNGYGLQFQSNSRTVAVQKSVNGAVTTLKSVTGQELTTGKQWLRFRVVGDQIMFRTWVNGVAEPSTWTTAVADSSITTAGQLHVTHARGGSNVGPRSIDLDDLTLKRVG